MEEYQKELRIFLYIERKNLIKEPVWLFKISRGLGLSKGEASKSLNLLESAGLIQKKKSFVLSNRHETTYHLTEKGRLLTKQN